MKKYYCDQHTDFTDSMSDTASVWAAKLKSGTISREDKARMDDWMSEDPAHKATFDRMNTIWDEFGEFENHPLVVGEMDKINTQTPKPGVHRFFGGLFSGSSFMKPMAAAATILLVVATALVMQQKEYFPVTTMPGYTVYQSETGEQKTVLLSDGSTAILDTNTKLSIQYTDTYRNAELIAGSAMFSVIHDSDKPFVVVANNTQIKVLGTEFNVSMQNGHKIVVAVLKGSVHVSQRAVSKMQEIVGEIKENKPVNSHEKALPPVIKKKKPVLAKVIISGESMIVDENKKVFQVKAANIKRISAWRDGKLDFDRAPLEEVISKINRYVDKEIVIGDDVLKEIRISLILRISDSKHFLTSLEELFPIDSRPSPGNKIILTKR